jgi:hypothetical protein
VITFVIAASGLKYVGIDTTTLGWLLCAMLLAAGSAWLAIKRPWQRDLELAAAAGTIDASLNGRPPLLRTEAPEVADASLEDPDGRVTHPG